MSMTQPVYMSCYVYTCSRLLRRLVPLCCSTSIGSPAGPSFSSVYGWLVSKDAPKETLDFMKALLGKDIQSKLAAEGLSISMVKGTAEAIPGVRLSNTVVWTVTYSTLTLSTTSPVFLEGMLGNALRISLIPERTAVDPAVDIVCDFALGCTMLFPASLIPERSSQEFGNQCEFRFCRGLKATPLDSRISSVVRFEEAALRSFVVFGCRNNLPCFTGLIIALCQCRQRGRWRRPSQPRDT